MRLPLMFPTKPTEVAMEPNRIPRGDHEPIRLPRLAPRPLDLSSFMLCGVPAADPALALMQQLYAWAFAQAQAVNQPSILERDLIAARN